MSAPNENESGRRRWATGIGVAGAVLVVALVVLAVLPRSATATASLTVTPRTDAGADAALLVADRYTALAGSAGTLRTAREGTAALTGVPLDQLVDGTVAQRSPGTATVTVRVTLADRASAAAAANAVVDTLVTAGADEDLVEVGRGAEATPSRATTSPDRLRWSLVALPLAVACGLVTAAMTGRRGRTARPGPPADPAVAEPPAEVVDDLPGFLDHPPGSPRTLAVPTPAVSAPLDRPGGATRPGTTSLPAERALPVPATRRGAAVATAAAVVLLVAVAVVVAVTGRSGDGTTTAGSSARASGAATTLTAPSASAAPGLDAAVATTSAPASATSAAAGALAFESVPLGADGVAASVTFAGVVLEQRAVGLTVTYPSVSLTTDGHRALAHVRLPTFNCLTTDPPGDPVAAGCARSLTEYADLTDPQLQVSRNGDRLELVGLFPTYTRSNGSAPAYTGRAYQLTAVITADGPEQNDSAPATGVVRIGLDSAATTPAPGVNLLQFPR